MADFGRLSIIIVRRYVDFLWMSGFWVLGAVGGYEDYISDRYVIKLFIDEYNMQ